MNSIEEKFNKKLGCSDIINDEINHIFKIINVSRTIGMYRDDYGDDVEYNEVLFNVIPKDKSYAFYEQFGYKMSYIRDVIKILNPDSYGFHLSNDDDKFLVFKKGDDRIAIAPDIGDWKVSPSIPLTELFRPKPSSVMVI